MSNLELISVSQRPITQSHPLFARFNNTQFNISKKQHEMLEECMGRVEVWMDALADRSLDGDADFIAKQGTRLLEAVYTTISGHVTNADSNQEQQQQIQAVQQQPQQQQKLDSNGETELSQLHTESIEQLLKTTPKFTEQLRGKDYYLCITSM